VRSGAAACYGSSGSGAWVRERGWGPEMLPSGAKVKEWLGEGSQLYGGVVDSAGTPYFVGDDGMLATIVDDTLTEVQRLVGNPPLRAGWFDGKLLWTAAANGEVHRVLPGGVGPSLPPLQVGGALRSIWGDGQGRIYVAGTKGLFRLADSTQAQSKFVPVATGVLWAVHGAGQQVWAVGADGQITRSVDSGVTWQALKAPAPHGSTALRAVYVPPKGPVWIAGSGGSLLRSDANGKLIVVETGTTNQLQAVRGSSSTDIWVGGHDRLYHLPD
jgi:hypothetical protein